MDVTEWMVAFAASSADPILLAIQDGTLTYPAEGDDPVLGVTWRRRTPTPEGVIGSWTGGSLVYAVGRVTVDAGDRLLARVERAFSIFGNGVRQPGDIYGSGKIRVPLRTVTGENLIIVQGTRWGPASSASSSARRTKGG